VRLWDIRIVISQEESTMAQDPFKGVTDSNRTAEIARQQLQSGKASGFNTNGMPSQKRNAVDAEVNRHKQGNK